MRSLALLVSVTTAACGRVHFDEAETYCFGARLTAAPYASSLEGGDGESTLTAYVVCTPAQLGEIGRRPEDWTKTFRLETDLDLAGVEVAPIGDATTAFTGVFDGGGHAIQNLALDRPLEDAVGLFGHLGHGARVGNVQLLDFAVTGRRSVGGLVGWAEEATTIEDVVLRGRVRGERLVGGLVGITEIYMTGLRIIIADVTAEIDVAGTLGEAGGIIGYVYNGNVTADLRNLVSSGTVSGGDAVGGLVGWGDGIELVDSHSSATIAATSSAGGLVGGTAYHPTLIASSYATGSVTCSGGECGGIIGYNEGDLYRSFATGDVRCGGSGCGGLASSFDDVVVECYATGNVTGLDTVGGLVGGSYGIVADSYATGRVEGRANVGGLVGDSGGGDVVGQDHLVRSYATGAVKGADFVGGLVGVAATNQIIRDVFATGPVEGNSTANRVSRLIGGDAAYTLTGGYFDAAATCTNTAGTCTTVGTSIAQPGYFHAASNAPLAAWDFSAVWRAMPAAPPQLVGPPAPP